MEDQNLYRIIELRNPDSEPFEVVYDGQSYGQLMPNQTRRYPAFIAKLAVKHLTDRILIKRNPNNPNLLDQQSRDKVAREIVVSEENYTPAPKSEAQVIQEQIERINRVSDLDRILGKNKPLPGNSGAGEVILPEDTDEAVTTPQTATAPPSVEAPVMPQEAPNPAPPASEPTREQLYKYATDTLGMDLTDAKTKAALDAMDIPKVIAELKWEPANA